jgi:hypothetical protein
MFPNSSNCVKIIYVTGTCPALRSIQGANEPFFSITFRGGLAMKRDDSEQLGAEGYIPRELLDRIQSSNLQISINFRLTDEIGVMAKGFAVSFYKELRRLGFPEEQIADFSTELLKFLEAKLAAYKKKIETK